VAVPQGPAQSAGSAQPAEMNSQPVQQGEAIKNSRQIQPFATAYCPIRRHATTIDRQIWRRRRWKA
jgi:hypothetical protein